jgi:hypothetical protein
MRAKVENICINDIHVDTERERPTKIVKTYHPNGLCQLAAKKKHPHEKPKQL